MSNSNEYMREYMLSRYHRRRNEAKILLGGKCISCGSTENLEFDHKDRKTKGFTIARLWSINKARFIEEIKKCQLLCRKCHQEKTYIDLGQKNARKNHGTLSSYRYCKCDLCKKAKSDWMKKYYKNHKRITINGKRVLIKSGP